MSQNNPDQDVAWMNRRMDDNDADLDLLQHAVGVRQGNPFDLAPFDLRVDPGLVDVGEMVCIDFTVMPGRGISVDPRKIESLVQLEADFLGAHPARPRTLTLQWQHDETGAARASVSVQPDRAGNWRIVWQVRDRRLSRSFAVVDGPKLVTTLWVGSNFPPVDDEVHRYDLAADTWVGDGWSPTGRPAAEVFDYLRPLVQRSHVYGDQLMPVLNARFLLPGIRNANLFLLPPAVQRRALQQIRRLWDILGLGPLRAIASYTIGHETVRILKELGIGVVNSLCVWQNVRDGFDDHSWLINHTGMPNAPYFVADDDFRKVAPGRSELMAFNMGTTSNIRMYDFFAYDGCATNTMPSQRYARNNAIAANIDRFSTVAEGWMHDAANHSGPLFVTVSLENFTKSDFWRQANREAVEFLIRRAREDKVAFAPALAVAGYYQRHYARQPRSIFYQPDALCGLPSGAKPARLPDRIEIADHRLHALYVQGQVLPQLLWDYTVGWNNPEWDHQEALRNLHLHILPETIAATVAPDRSLPRQADLRGVEIQTFPEPLGDGLLIRVKLTLPHPLQHLPLGLWNLPLAAINRYEGPAEIIPVRDGWTGNLHAVAVFEALPRGSFERTLRLWGVKRRIGSAEFCEGTLSGRTYGMTEGVRTYIWKHPEAPPCRFPVHVPAGTNARVRYNDGTETTPDSEGTLWIELDEHWKRQSPCLLGVAPRQTGGTASIGQPVPLRRMSYLRDWQISSLQDGAGNLDGVSCPEHLDALELKPVRMDYYTVDLYRRLRERPGDTLLYCVHNVDLEHAMEGAVLLGYDGPIKAWIDRSLIHHDPETAGPIVMDAIHVPIRLEAGRHEIIVAMGSGQGRACAFSFRFEQTHLSSPCFRDT